MSKSKLVMFFLSLFLAIPFFAWTPGDALAKDKSAKDKVVKGKVTRDDVAKYLGKVTPNEQAAAAKRARQLGLLPGVAGFSAQPPAPGATR